MWIHYCDPAVMKYPSYLQICLTIGLLLCHIVAFGKNQNIVAIEHRVIEFVKEQHSPDAILNVQLQRLDSRLKLNNCDSEVEVNWSPGSPKIGRTTLNVSCSSPKPWRIFVRAAVERESLVWILNTQVRKGDVLTRHLITQQSVMLGSNRQRGIPMGVPISEIEPWLGQVFVQALQAGRVIGSKSLKPPNLVMKGETVSISYKTSRLAVKTKGVALTSGALEDRISVKNSVSNKVIEAIVVGQSSVAISQ